ncbi:MAG: hypothetical protein ACRBEE_07265 [Arenicella sp.]
MLNFLFKALFLVIFLFNAYAVQGKEKIDSKLLGKNIFSLFKDFQFQIIDEYDEYDDLKNGEQYWIGVNKNSEFLILKTSYKKIVSLIITNPDFESNKKLTIGDSFEKFISRYPKAMLISSKLSSNKPYEKYYVLSEDVFVIFDKNRLIWSFEKHLNKNN